MVLAAMTGVMAVAAGLVQVLRAEETRIDVWLLVAPFLILTLPAMLLTSAVAVLFETIRPLSGGAGNIVWFFLWALLLVGDGSIRDGFSEPTRDWLGRGAVLPDMLAAAGNANPEFDPDSSSVTMGITFRERGWELRTFRWDGMHWTASALAGRLLWVLAALGVATAAALPFDRFDPSRGASATRAPPQGGRAWVPWRRRKEAAPVAPEPVTDVRHLPPAPAAGRMGAAAFATLLGAELKLSLRDRGRGWFFVLAGLAIAALVLPIDVARARILPLLWVWPILVWSPMGTRAVRHRAEQVLFSAPRPVTVQLAATWGAGFALALVAGAPIGLRFVLAGDLTALLAWGVGAAFIPALALALGEWSGSPRAFEAIYIVWWYTGPLQPLPLLDFMGASQESVAMGMPIVYGGAAIVLGLAAMLGRTVRLRA
jgi:hypothetical protein